MPEGEVNRHDEVAKNIVTQNPINVLPTANNIEVRSAESRSMF